MKRNEKKIQESQNLFNGLIQNKLNDLKTVQIRTEIGSDVNEVIFTVIMKNNEENIKTIKDYWGRMLNV